MSVVVALGAAPAAAQNLLIGTAGEAGAALGIGGSGGAGGIGGGGGGGSGGGGAGGGGGGYGAGGGAAGFVYGSNSGGAGGAAADGAGANAGSDSAGLGGAGNNGGSAGANGVQGPTGPFDAKVGGSAASGVAAGVLDGGVSRASFTADATVNGALGIGGSGGGGGGASGTAAGGAGTSGGAGELTITAGTTTVTGAVLVGGSGGGAGGGSGNAAGGTGGSGGEGRLSLNGGTLVAGSLVVGGSAGGSGSAGAAPGGQAGAGTLTISAGILSVAGGVTVRSSGLVDFQPAAGQQLSAGFAISGEGRVVQSGGGTTVMTGDNTYTGGTTISAGTLQIGAGGTSGRIVGNVVNDGALVFNRSDASSFNGVISGSGSLRQAGSGTLELTGINTYAGGTAISGGTLRVAGDGALGMANGTLSLDGGGRLQSTGAFTSARDVTLVGAGTIASAGDLTMNGIFTGSGSLDVQAGAAAITLTNAANDFGGIVSLAGGTTQINDRNALTLGTLATGDLTVTSHGKLNLGQGSASSIDARSNGGQVAQSGAVSVLGALSVDAGAGDVVLDRADNDFRGALSLRGANISVAAGGDLSVSTLVNGVNGAVSLVAGGVLSLSGTAIDTGSAGLALASNGGALDVSGSLRGGEVSLAGRDGISLAADVSAANVLKVSSKASVLQTSGVVTAGTLTGRVDGDVALGGFNRIGAVGDFSVGGALSLRNQEGLALTGNVAAGSVALDVAQGVVVTGSLGATGKGASISLAGGTRLQVGDGAATGVLTGNVHNEGTLAFNRSDVVSFAGAIDGKGALVQQGTGTLVLTGANSYSGGTVVKSGVLQGTTASLQGDIANDAIVTFEQAAAGSKGTYAGTMTGTGSLRKIGEGELELTAVNTYSGGTRIDAGTLSASVTGALGSGPVSVAGGAALRFRGAADMGSVTLATQAGGMIDFTDSVTAPNATIVNNAGGTVRLSQLTADGTSIGAISGSGQVQLGAKALTTGTLDTDAEISGVVSGLGGSLVKTGRGTLTLSGANTYTGGTALRQGRLNVGHNQALGTGVLAMDDDTTLGFAAEGLSIANPILLTGHNDPVIDTGAFSGTLAGAITGGGFITKEGTGTLTLSGANTYTGATQVAQGTLRAGAPNTLSAGSAHSVAAGATLDLAGFDQAVVSLANSGTVSLAGAAPGATLTVTGGYVGHNGVLRVGTALGGNGPADRLVLDGGAASGRTQMQVVNVGGLGALTSGNGIEVISARNGATTTAQTTKDAFSLAGGHVDAGAYEYRLYAADANGAGENWFLRSSVASPAAPGVPGVPAAVTTYRTEASLYAALAGQLRQGNLAMLGDLRKRVGDDDGAAVTAATPDHPPSRRAWARVLSTDIDIRQGGVLSPTSKGRLTGFQAGTDLLSMRHWRAGIYVGQLDGDARVNGFASGIQGLAVGRNDLRSQYVGAYGTYTNESGFFADAVVQSGRHRYTVEPLPGGGAAGKGNSLVGSIEVGRSFPLGGSGWHIEPQLQLVHQHMDLSNSAIIGAVVQPQADSGWLARAGVRVKGEIGTGLGTLQPYGRFNVYKASSGADVARFVNGASRTDIAAPTGGTSTELAGGFALALGSSTTLYGEFGKLWASGGNAKVKSSVNGSVGIRVKW